MRAWPCLATALAFSLATASAAGADFPVPINMQIPLFQKIWMLDRSFGSKTDIVVAVVYQESNGASAAVKAQIMNWADGRGRRLHAIAVAIDGPTGLQALRSVSADVFYVTPLRAVDITEIAQTARERHIRTVTGMPEYASRGLGVAIDVRDDRPLIVINVAASKAEGSSFPAQLLQLARLVGVSR
jgi:hypothetical protein